MNGSQLDKKVKSLFYGYENIKIKLSLMEGPGTFCYSLSMLYKFSENKLNFTSEKIIQKHLATCQWCRWLVGTMIALKLAFLKAKSEGKEKQAIKYYQEVIVSEVTNPETPLMRKILRAWNIL